MIVNLSKQNFIESLDETEGEYIDRANGMIKEWVEPLINAWETENLDCLVPGIVKQMRRGVVPENAYVAIAFAYLLERAFENLWQITQGKNQNVQDKLNEVAYRVQEICNPFINRASDFVAEIATTNTDLHEGLISRIEQEFESKEARCLTLFFGNLRWKLLADRVVKCNAASTH